MEWQFKISNGVDSATLKAELIYLSYQIEHIKVSGDGISIVLQSNRPLLEAIELKRPITWKLIQGDLKNNDALEGIIKGVEYGLKHQREAA